MGLFKSKFQYAVEVIASKLSKFSKQTMKSADWRPPSGPRRYSRYKGRRYDHG